MYKYLLFFSALWMHLSSEEIDIFLKQHLCKSPIVSTQQILIPGYPNAYNPSLIPYKGKYLLSFRYTARFPDTLEGYRADASFIGLAKLNKNFKVSEKSVQLLNIQSYSSRFSLTAEDGRLILLGDRIFLFFNDLNPYCPEGFSMYFAELIEEKGEFRLKEPAKLLNYLFSIPVEKNWSPFVHQGKLYLIYADDPRTILELDSETGNCREMSRMNIDWNWPFGQIRGGTPAYPIDDFYLTFFHSSFPTNIKKGRAFVMGAYLFDKHPPFTPRWVTPHPLGQGSDYTQDNPAKIVFPSGLVIEGNSLFVVWGKADKQIRLTEFDKQKLLDSMHEIAKFQ